MGRNNDTVIRLGIHRIREGSKHLSFTAQKSLIGLGAGEAKRTCFIRMIPLLMLNTSSHLVVVQISLLRE